jgi:hypothetical protein
MNDLLQAYEDIIIAKTLALFNSCTDNSTCTTIVRTPITYSDIHPNMYATDHPLYGHARPTHVLTDYIDRLEYVHSDIEEEVMA